MRYPLIKTFEAVCQAQIGRSNEMIEIQYKNGTFLARGTFSMGIAGVYENKEFGQGNITIGDTLEGILRELRREQSSFYEPLRPFLKDRTDGAAVAGGLEAYYNQKETEIRKNIKQINDCILCHFFDDLEACEYPFWEIEEAVVPGSLDGYDMDNLDREIYQMQESIGRWGYEAYDRKPNNGTMEKPDIEGRLRRQYPMFNFDGLYQSMIPEGIHFHGRFMEFQFSDGWGGELICAGYDSFDENFASCDWHNH